MCPYLYVHIKQEEGKITTLGGTHFALNLDYSEEGKRSFESRSKGAQNNGTTETKNVRAESLPSAGLELRMLSKRSRVGLYVKTVLIWILHHHFNGFLPNLFHSTTDFSKISIKNCPKVEGSTKRDRWQEIKSFALMFPGWKKSWAPWHNGNATLCAFAPGGWRFLGRKKMGKMGSWGWEPVRLFIGGQIPKDPWDWFFYVCMNGWFLW